MTMALTIGTDSPSYHDNLTAHYSAVRQRLRANPPVRNRLKTVLAEVKAKEEAVYREKMERLAELRERQRQRQEQIRLAKLAAMPRKERLAGMPKFRAAGMADAVFTILESTGLTWNELVSSTHRGVPVRARAMVCLILRDGLGWSWPDISRAVGRSQTTVRCLCSEWREPVGKSAVFARALSCVSHKS